MNVQAVLKEAEEILFFEFLEKNAAVSPQWLKRHRKEVNDLFLKYIREKTFPDVTTKGKKVLYKDLDDKYKEKVWYQFMDTLKKEIDPIEEQIEEIIRNFKPVSQPAV
jgi:hypothetical protein